MPPKAPVAKAKQFPHKLPNGLYRHRYGIDEDMPLPEWIHELRCWVKKRETGLPPYEHLKKAIQILQPDSVWHPWREERFQELCNEESAFRIGKVTIRNLAWVGTGACVAGGTRLHDPVSGDAMAIEKLCDLQIRPTVLTIAGPVKASIPFKKGRELLYEITLNSGDCFQATAGHRVMLASGVFAPVASLEIGARLAGSSLARPVSTSGTCLSTHGEGGLRSLRTEGDSQFDCHSSPRFYGEQLRRALEVFQGTETLQTGALKHNHRYEHSDAQQLSRGHNHFYQYSSHPSNSGSFPMGIRNRNYELCPPVEEISLPVPFLYRRDEQSHSSKHLAPLILKQGPDSESTHHSFLRLQPPAIEDLIESLVSRNRLVQERVVCNIRCVGERDFYDLHVPFWNHYFAEGVFHHNSGKTNCAAVFAFHYWLAAPDRTAVVLTSTSKTKMRQRAWAVIQECWVNAKIAMEEAGISGPHMVPSMMILRASKMDEQHAVFGQAIEAGEVHKALENIKGVHAERMVLVVDEAIAAPEAVFKLIPNMLKGCREFILISTANGPTTHLDSFSKICTPVGGWNAVTVANDRWETRAHPEFQLPRGVCQHFDGTKSPNVVAGKTLYPFLYTWENWLQVRDNSEIQRTSQFWSQDRGFWPPEGFVNTVLTEQLIDNGNARGQVAFEGRTTPAGSLDSGFGGDNCVLRFGRLGRIQGAKRAIQIDERIIIPILVDEVDPETGKKVPAEYQIARRVMTEARARGVKPEWFGVEATGTGRGVAAVLTQEWGEVVWVESGGNPTDMPASEEDPRPAKEIYDRKITELWFSVQAFVKGGQLGGLCEEDVIQFCSRTYEYVGKKYKIETKQDLKARLGRSPDEADSCACLVHVARLHGMETRGPRGDRMLGQWDREIKRQQSVYTPELMYAPEEKA